MKELKSAILERLDEKFQWINVEDELPPSMKKVVVRIVDPTKVIRETEDGIYPLELIMLGYYSSDGTWEIAGPYPKYDYSPLSDHNVLRKGAIVTHWAVADVTAITQWESRLDFYNEYTTLDIQIDSDKEELLYLALTEASSTIGAEIDMLAAKQNRTCTETERMNDLLNKIRILYDLQACIDINQRFFEGKKIPRISIDKSVTDEKSET